MKSIRIGNDFSIVWSLSYENGNPYDLTGKSFKVYLCASGKQFEVTNYTVSENTIQFVFLGKEQHYLGQYDLKYVENDGEIDMLTYDTRGAFELVTHSWLAIDGSQEGVEIDAVEVSSRFDFIAPGDYATWEEVQEALALKQDVLTFDDAPTAGSNNPVKSGGIHAALAEKRDICPELETDRDFLTNMSLSVNGELGQTLADLADLIRGEQSSQAAWLDFLHNCALTEKYASLNVIDLGYVGMPPRYQFTRISGFAETYGAFAEDYSYTATYLYEGANARKLMTITINQDYEGLHTASLVISDAVKAPINSPVFTGTPQVPTPAAGDDSQKAANTAFVKTALEAYAMRKADKVTEVGPSSTDEEIPTAKAVHTAVSAKYTKPAAGIDSDDLSAAVVEKLNASTHKKPSTKQIDSAVSPLTNATYSVYESDDKTLADLAEILTDEQSGEVSDTLAFLQNPGTDEYQNILIWNDNYLYAFTRVSFILDEDTGSYYASYLYHGKSNGAGDQYKIMKLSVRYYNSDNFESASLSISDLVDSSPANGSNRPVSSGSVYAALAGKMQSAPAPLSITVEPVYDEQENPAGWRYNTDGEHWSTLPEENGASVTLLEHIQPMQLIELWDETGSCQGVFLYLIGGLFVMSPDVVGFNRTAGYIEAQTIGTITKSAGRSIECGLGIDEEVYLYVTAPTV